MWLIALELRKEQQQQVMQSVFSREMGQNWNPLNLLSFCKQRQPSSQAWAPDTRPYRTSRIRSSCVLSFAFIIVVPLIWVWITGSAAWATSHYLDLGPGSPAAFPQTELSLSPHLGWVCLGGTYQGPTAPVNIANRLIRALRHNQALVLTGGI